MKKTEKISVLISIVLISLIAIGAVSAADDTAAADDADLAAVDEVQAIDDTNTNDDIDYESNDIIVTDTGDSGDGDVAVVEDSSKNSKSLGATQLTEGETKSFSQLAQDVSGSSAMLSGANYKYNPETDSAYANGITLSNGLTIIGGGATIDGNNMARIFYIPEGVSVTLMNLNLINGKADMGAAIYNNGSLTLMNSNVNDNTATIGGGGIYNNGGSLTITGTTFDGNDITDRSKNADDYGGAAIYNKKGSVLLSGSTVSNSIKNIVPRAGVDTATDLCSAAVTSEEGDLTITNCLFEKNSGCYGGALNVGGGNLMVSDSVFKDNYAFNGAALLFYGAGTYVISNSNFTNNIANGTGSGINNVGSGGAIAGTEYNEGSIITNCIFDGNCASKGGAINCDNVKVIDSKFINNIASSEYSGDYQGTKNTVGGNGAAVYAYVNVDITGSTLNNNVAEKRGGAIYAVGSGTTVTVSDSVIDGNDITYRAENADNGGAAIYNNGGKLTLDNVQVTNNLKNIVIREGNDGDLIDAAIFTTGETTITNCNISKNSGSWGGGVYVTNGATLTVKDSTFEENMATFGAALYNEKAKLIVDNCDFIKNHCEGVGSSGTSNTQAGAILSMGAGSTATITNSRFKENSAKVGGAVSLAGVQDSTVSGCTFTENVGTSEGGAIYAWTQDGATVTVSGNTFTDNTAPFGSAISNDGTMSITENTITGATTVPIGNYYGTITSPVYVKTLNGETVTSGAATNDITATLTDDKGNAIVDRNLVLVVNGANVETGYDKTTGIHTGSYTFTTPGTYAVTAEGFDETHTTAGSLVYTGGTFTELQNLINAAEAGATITLDHDIVFNEGFDDDVLKEGIVVDKAVTIVGADGVEICGNELARVFKVTNPATLTLKDVTVCHGAADEGAGVYVENGATLVATGATFVDNTAVTRGGAIYSEGTVDLKDSTLKENYIDNRGGAGDENKGGAALFNKGGIATLDNVQVIDNVKDYENGDVLDGAIVAMGKTTITNSNFKGNKGRYGGAITATETDETLTVKGTTFEENLAIFGGAIYDSGVSLVVENCKFYNNTGVGPGSAGTSSSQGGAILVMGENAGANIKGSDFINNTADLGGAVAVSSGTTGTFTIDDCTFTENKANDEGGAIYGYTTDSPITVSNSEFTKNNGGSYGGAIEADGDTDLNVIDSKFTQNSASYGGAIITGGNTVISGSTFTGNDAASLTEAIYSWYSGKTLALTGNTITDDGIQIYAANGVIMTTPLKIRILDNDTVNIHMAPYDITGVVTDDNGNALVYMSLRFKVGDDIVSGLSVDIATGVYKTTFTPTQTGEFVVSTNLAEATLVETGVLKISRSLTDLANIIAAAEAGDEITLDGDYAYIPEFDADLVNGIVIDKVITIKGAEGADTISGSDLARLFKVVNGGDLTLDGVTITNGKAADGAAIYLESGAKLTATDSTFKDNTATYSGGAIYADNAQITLTDCVLDGNDATDATSNNDTGGAAIYGNSATIALVNTNVTNNGNKELDRSKGDLINGVINLMNSDATVTGCVFENNTGIYGGAITTQAPAGAKTLTISESNFTANAAYTGGAVYVGDNVKYTIEDSIFNANNKATGEGSPGYTSGGGAIQIWHAGEGTIDNVTIKNSIATQGGAIGVEGATVTIKDSTFEGNTATSEGGAIYAYNDATTTVTGCTFTDNDAPFGSAISNDGKLSLSGNTMTGGSVVPIANYFGTITSTVNVVTLDGQDVVTATATNDVTAVLKDDNGNAIIDKTLVLIVNNEEVTTSYNKVTGIMTGSYTFTQPGTYEVTAKDIDAEHTTAGKFVFTAGTFTELQNLINAATAGATITLDHDITYNEAFDGDALKEGIAITKDVTIVGADGIEICGNNKARVFKITNDAFVTLENLTICHGAAEKGAGVYVDSGSMFLAENVTFAENVAVYRGGAIYSEGIVVVERCDIHDNDITFRTANDDNGGAAIYNMKGELIITKTNITNNLKNIVIRNGNAGDLLVGVVVTTGDTLIRDSYFANNTGSWGGAISSLGYMNDKEYECYVINTTFEGNNATFGGAIFVESSNLVVEDSRFNNNLGVGVGSSGTSNTQGGAIVVHPAGSSVNITGSNFTANSANVGGAVSLAGVDKNSLIENCIFTDNTASSEGGAVYLWTQGDAVATVKDSKFSGNTAPWGNAISNDGKLSLSGNTISTTSADIGNWFGTIDSKVVSTILENTTYNWHAAEFLINATLTDDNGNLINDHNFKFIITYTAFRGTIEVPATFYTSLGYYQGKFTPDKAGEYLINLGYEDQQVATSVIKVYKSLTDLANIIAAADAGAVITLDDDYAYIDEFDSAIKDGIVIDKDITIKGAEDANIINGSDLARLFKVTDGKTLTLDGVTIANGKADDGAGIYVDSGSKLVATGSTFKDNTATYSGGAIYADNAQITLTDCVLDGNDATDATSNNDTGGAAIYGNSATIALVNTNVTNNGNKELDRSKGDLINGVINLMNSDATVTGCVFENNTGIYGGAITTQAPAGAKTLTIKESNFTANAAYTGGAVYVGDNVKYTIEDSIFDANNKATGEGSPGYTSGGGAIQIWHAGEGTIDNVTIKNSIATQGGAIGVEGATVTIKDSKFEGNTATSEGGAIYAYNDATTTVTGCTFTNNDAPFGSAISNDGTLSLSGNTITGGSVVPIANYYGTIISTVNVVTLDGQDVVTATATNDVTAILKDDNGNAIIDKTLVLIVNGEEITTSYNKVTGIMTGSCTLTQPGTYAVTAKGIDADHTVAGNLVYTAGTFTELQNLINAAEAGATITLDHDIVYNEAFDGDALKEGIVVDKAVTIVGADGIEICGNDLARVFKVANAAALTLKDITICDGAAEKGAGVFVESGASLVADNVTFTENVAVKRGGAVYSEGAVNIANSRIDKNNVTYRSENDDNGGAAIYNLGGTLTVTDTNITDNQNDIVPRDGNSGDYINSAIITTADASFTGCNISKNSGSWGGGIYVNNGATLTVKDSVFEENFATFGAAIYDENAKVIIDNCNFTNNYCGGVGSPGTSNTQAGAVLVMGNGASATITNSKFNKNSAKTGGAVSISQATGDVLIDNCEFTENTASYEGGAIYNYIADGATLTVSNSKFTDNTATNWGDAISNDGALKLDKNTITGGREAAIGNWLGTIDSKVVSRILENTTYNWHTSEFLINATLTDDNGNKINDKFFKFIITYTAFRGTIEVPATYYSDLGYYQGKFTPDKAGEYLINLGYENEEVATSVITVHKSLIDLANLIANDEDGIIDLDDDYAYIAEFDESIVNGIVIDKAVTINGAENANIINGSNLARLFDVTNGGTLTLNGVTIANGKADDGAGIYLESGAKLTATDSTFKDNTATYSGGAIYADGAEISLTNCVLDGNDVTDYTKNNDTGGAAIYGQSSTIALVNTNVTNNGNKELDRTKGDLVNGVINLMNSDATVTGCVFENNTGIYGGAITTQAPAGAKTLTISESNFTANAAYTGGAVYVGDNVKFTIEDSIFDANNKATGEGSPGYTSGGGAIQLWHAGEGTIDNVTIKNSIATQGGAIGVEGSSPVTIKGSTFTDNTATSEGGAIYAYNDAVLTVTDSTFSGNTAPWGNAISNDGKLTLSGNTISTTSADIANYYGSIVSPVTVKILGNGTDDGTGIVPAALGDTVTITAVVTDDNGNLIKDINFDFEVTNGDAVKEIHAVYNANTKQYEAQYVIANAGDHAVSMNYVSDNLVLYTGLYTVPKANVTFVVNVENIPAGEKAKVDGQLIGANDAGLEGMDIVVVVNGVDYNITTGDNGTFSFEIEDLPIGQYEAVGIFYGTDNYNRALCTDDFNVTKLTPVLAVEGEDYLMPGATATVGITLTGASGQGIAGTVIVTVDGKDYVVYTDASGKAELEIPGLVSNVYPITAKFIGNDNYETVVNDTESIEFFYKAASFDIVIDDITYGDAVVIIVENATDLAGNPLSGMVFGNIESATGDGAGLTVYVTDGSGTATISRKLTVGTYNVVATFTDDYYEYISETKEFTFDVSPAVAVITTDVANYPFNETGKLNINVVDLAGTLLNGTVSVQVDDEIYALDVEVVNGTAVVDLTGIDIGEHSVVVTFANPNYRETDLVDHFNVTKVTPIVEVNDTEAEWGTSVDIPVKVTDESGNPVTGTVIVIVDWLVDGKSYVVELDENGMGTAHFVINEATGDLTITARFIGNDNFTDKNATATLTITESTDLEIEASANEPEFGEDTIITVTGKDGMGAVVPITAVNVTIDGVTTEYPVADDGTVNLGKLPVGETEITVSVDDGKHKAATETINVTVDPAAGVQLSASAANYAIGETGTLIVTVKDNDGKPLDGPLYIEIDGEIYLLGGKAIDGGAEIALTNLDVGDHVAVVTFANSSYLPVDYTTHFTVTKATPVITVTGDVIDLEEVAIVNVTVMDGTTPVSGNAVVTVNGVSYAVTIAADGRGFVDIENLPFGEYPITAKFLANDKYEEAVYSGDAKVVVNMPTDVTFDLAVDDDLTTVTVSNAKDAAGNELDGYIMGELLKDGQKVANLDMSYLADGTGTIAIPADLDAGDYTVMITVMDSEFELTGTDEINFTVEPKAAVVIGDAADYAFDQTGKLEINVTDVAETPIAGNVTVVIDEGPYATVEINGNTVIDLTGFDIGAHIVNVIFTNPNYRDAEWVGGFNVTKVTPTITVTGSTVDFEEVATVNVTVMAGETPVAGNAVVTVNGVNYAVEIGADGKGTLSIADLASGSYDVAAKFLANDNYEAADYTGDAKVIVKASEDLTLEVTANEPTVGEDAVIKVTATDGEGKPVAVDKVNVTVNGETAEYDVADDGTVTIPADKLSVGDNAITVAIGDATKDATVTVAPKDTASVTVGTNAENITIEAKDGTTPLAGTASVSIDGATPSIVTVGEDGKANVPLGDLAPGKHTVEVTFINDNYEPVTEVATIIVPKATPTITVTGSEVDFGQDATVTVTVKDGETPVAGNAVVTVNGVNYAVEIGADGTGTLTIAGLATNEYPIAAKFLANDKYEEAVYSGDAKVVVGPSKDLTLEVTANEPTVGEDAVIKVTATDGEGNPVTVDTVLVTIGDGEPEEYPVAADGTVTIPADKLAAGDNAITVTVDDGQHNLATKDITVVVSAPAVLGTNITVTVTNITYGESAVIKFTLTDENGKPLNGKLNVTVEDIVKEVPIDDGEGTLTLPSLSADTYPVVANFVGNDTYAPSTGTAYFNVAKNATKIIYSDMTTIAVDYPNDGRVGEYFVWRLVDANGNAIANAKMQIGFNGVVYDATTNESGYCHLQINLRNAGLFTFAISFLGDENHNASFAVARIDVKHQKPTLTVPNKSYKASAKTKTLTATFKSNKGTLIANKKVTFTVNGKTYSAKTNDKGVASVNVTITKAGTYTVTAKYAGDITYAAINKTATLKIT